MADRIRKMLQRLSIKQQKQLTEIIQRIIQGNLIGLDIKKLQGMDHIYRVRKGDMRVIFEQPPSKGAKIIAIERRSDTTYHSF